jgi:ubiquinone/menaquinone biosynthesis C-methylase UbiE
VLNRYDAEPMTEPSELIAVFDEVASTYDGVDVDFFTPMGAELVRRARIAPGEAVLDVGCGRGAVLGPAAEAAGPTGRVVGTDLAPGMVALTSAAFAGLPNVTVAAGDAQAPDFPEASFDVVTAGLVLFFLPDPRAGLAAYRRLLRPGGRLAFTSFAAYDPRYPRAMRALARYAGSPPPRPEHPMFASDASVRDELTAQGYTGLEIGTFEVRSRFRDTGHWFDWVGSHGGRQLVRRIPAEQRDAAVAEAAAILQTPGEPLVLTTSVRVAVARP